MLGRLWSTKPFALDVGLLLLRIGLGALMMTHGWPKLRTYSTEASTFPDPLGVSSPISLMLTILAELICSAFLIVGLFTRAVLIPLMITMLVVIFILLAHETLEEREHAILFLVPYLTLLLTGPGRYSVDHLLKR